MEEKKERVEVSQRSRHFYITMKLTLSLKVPSKANEFLGLPVGTL